MVCIKFPVHLRGDVTSISFTKDTAPFGLSCQRNKEHSYVENVFKVIKVKKKKKVINYYSCCYFFPLKAKKAFVTKVNIHIAATWESSKTCSIK